MIRIACPHCSRTLQVGPNLAGKVIGCPACKGKLTVPAADPASDYEVVEDTSPPPPPPPPAPAVARAVAKPVAAPPPPPAPVRARVSDDDDDDDDDRPRRRRRRDDDDDDDDDEKPKKKRKKKRKSSSGGSGKRLAWGAWYLFLGCVLLGIGIYTLTSEKSRKIAVGALIGGPITLVYAVGYATGMISDDEDED